MEPSADYLIYYDDESYLIEKVGKSFRKTGVLEAVDLYMMFIWKANRAKNRHRDRLKALAHGSFREAASRIGAALFETKREKDRLQLLMENWGFMLPTASAILSLLYPDEFTVYDYRVSDELCMRKDLSYRSFSDSLWADYEEFRNRVMQETPDSLSLRDKDRFLTGRSLRLGAIKDCAI